MSLQNPKIPVIIDVLGGSYVLEVDDRFTLRHLIRLCAFDYTDCTIREERFPAKPEQARSIQVYLLDLSRNGLSGRLSVPKVLDGVKELGFRPVNIRELLHFSLVAPEIQLHRRVISLGSIWQDEFSDQHVPVLKGGDTRGGNFRHFVLSKVWNPINWWHWRELSSDGIPTSWLIAATTL